MIRFCDWLQRRLFIESYYDLDADAYNRLFDEELDRLRKHLTDSRHLDAVERMRNFNWIAYIFSALRREGYREPRELAERTHDLATKLLSGKLFRGLDQERSGPIDARFRTALTNAIKNLKKAERTRRRHLPSVPLGPGTMASDILAAHEPIPLEDISFIHRFRDLVRERLGDLAVAILDARLGGQEMKSLIGRPEIGAPGPTTLKRLVRQIKRLAQEFADQIGDEAFAREIERAMEREAATIGKRLVATTR